MRRYLVMPAVMAFFAASLAALFGMPGRAEASGSYPYSVFLTFGPYGSGNGQTVDPAGVALDASGDVYVADTGNSRIEKFDARGNYLTQWGSYGAGNGQLHNPAALAVDASGNVYVVDNGNNRIEKFDSSGNYLAQWGSAGAGNGQFNFGTNVGIAYTSGGIAVDASGNVYVADTGNNRIEKFDSNGNYLAQWGTYGSGNGQFRSPIGVAVDASGDVYVSDEYNARVEKFDPNGNYLSYFGGTGVLNLPAGVAVDASGNLYVADSWDNRVAKFGPGGNYLAQGTGYLNYVYGVAADSAGFNVYAVTNANNGLVVDFNPEGTITATFLLDSDGVTTPLTNAYIYLQKGSQLPPREQYYENAQYILGPSDANGNLSVNVPAGAYYVLIRQESGSHYAGTSCYNYYGAFCSYYGPPVPGDYVWHSGSPAITVAGAQTVNLGTVYASIFGQPMTVSGTVKGASGKPLAGWAVKAATVPCESGNWAYAHSFNECGAVKYPAWTDANGNYTITIKDPGTYYVYASPALNFANTNYPGGYPTCTTAVGCEACGDYYYFNCPVSVTSSVTGENITVPGY